MSDLLPHGSKGGYFGEGIIIFSGKPSTRTRLHELAHKKLGHIPGKMPVREFISKEIDAESWAWEMMGKKPNYRVGFPVYCDLIDFYDYSADEALALVSTVLRRKGIRVDSRATSWFLEKKR